MSMGPKGADVRTVPVQSFTGCPGCRIMKLGTTQRYHHYSSIMLGERMQRDVHKHKVRWRWPKCPSWGNQSSHPGQTRGSSPEEPSFAHPAARRRAGFHKAMTFILGLQRHKAEPAGSLSACWEEFVSKGCPGAGMDGTSMQWV